MILRSFCTTQLSLLLFHLQHLYFKLSPPSTSPLLLSRQSPLSPAPPIRAVDPSLRRGGGYVTDATLTLNPGYQRIGGPGGTTFSW
jgi:hypothetical protein